MGEFTKIAVLHKRIIKKSKRRKPLLHRSYRAIALMDC
jgi:hypothetical protein